MATDRDGRDGRPGLERPRRPAAGVLASARTALLLGAALLTAACTADALAADRGLADTPSGPAMAGAAPRASLAATPLPTPTAAVLAARHAAAYVFLVQGNEQSDNDAALSRDVCSATFSELEFAAQQGSAYQDDPTLATFMSGLSQIAWSCEIRRVDGIRSGVRALSAVEAALSALGH